MAKASNYVEALKKPRSVQITRSQLAESFFYLNGYPLSLADYPHMRLIHDISPKAMVLKFSRQCLYENQFVNLACGNQVLAKNLKAGDPIIGFNTETLKNELTKISNVWDNGTTHIYEIRTRTGRVAHVTDNHPFYMIKGWKEASKLVKGDLIAISKDNSCGLSSAETVPDEHFIIAAYLLAEGSLTSGSIGFTNTRKECVDELQKALHKVDPKLTLKIVSPNAKQYQYRVSGHGVGKPHPLKPTLLKWGMLGKGSADKFHPDFVWNLIKEQLCHYLRIWWDTDGYVAKHKNGHYYPGIALISKQLTQGIQELLLKLGIHSTISVMQPPIYGGTNKYVYRVSVEGNESKQRFFDLIKTHKNPSNPTFKENSRNQQLVIDASFVEEQLKTIKHKKQKSMLYFNRGVNYYTLDKVKRILTVENLPELEKVINSDIYFDKVVEVNYLGEHPSIAIEVEGTHTFQVNNLITKNTSKSSSLANIMAADAIMRSKNPNKGGSGGFQQMYVSPTVEQTKVFSHDRLTPVLDGSPWVKSNFMDPKLIQNVFMKQLKNGSKMYLRYALQSADRLRGFTCSEVHEYHTLRGWVPVKDLREDDVLLTKNEKNNTWEWQKPTKIIVQDYSGPMDIYTAKGFRCEVTPDHRMHLSFDVRADHNYKDKTIPLNWNTDYKSKDLYNRNFKLGIGDVGDMSYKSSKPIPEFFELPEFSTTLKADGTPYSDGQLRTFPAIKLPLKPFMRWMGWWLSEGWTALNACIIGIAQDNQHNPANSQDINSLFDGLFPQHTKINSKQDNLSAWQLNGEYRTLYEWLKPLGKSGDKYIPAQLLEYTEYLPELLDALYCGDGDNCTTYKKNDKYKDHLRLNTKSEQLANTVQTAWLLLGKLASIRHRDRKTCRMYTVELKARTYFNFYLNRPSCSGYVKQEHYNGKIYCVQTPNQNFVARHAIEKMPFVTGNSVDKFYWDEVQDLHADIIPVAEQAMSRSYYKERIYAGTPKLTQGTLATLWFRSTMNEFLPKCEHCNKWNLLDEHNIGMKGLICKFCGGGLNPRNGQWVRTAPKENDKYKMEGFRVCALHFYGAPWVDWKEDILLPYETQPRNIFYNEILGLEYDQGSSPISEEDIKKCCTGGPMKQGPDMQTQMHRLFFGIDYGPMNSTESYTVLLVMHKEGKKTRVVFAKKYIGKEADFAFIHKDIVEQFHRWHIVALGADHGLGEATNSELRSKLGQHKVIAFQHQANQKEEIRWNAKMKAYTLGRTPIMTRFFSEIKAGKFIFPQWDEWEPFAKDILAPVIDYDKDKIKMFYVNSRPDDTFHALIYGKTALDLVNSMVSW